VYPLGDVHPLKWLHETPQKLKISEPGPPIASIIGSRQRLEKRELIGLQRDSMVDMIGRLCEGWDRAVEDGIDRSSPSAGGLFRQTGT
jgi:hypothetical protein